MLSSRRRHTRSQDDWSSDVCSSDLTNTSGRLVSRVINDVNQMANAVAGVLKDLFQQGLTFLAMIGVIVYQNWKQIGRASCRERGDVDVGVYDWTAGVVTLTS